MGPVSKTPLDKTLTRLDADKEFGKLVRVEPNILGTNENALSFS